MRRAPHNRHRRVGANRERQCSSPGHASSTQSLGKLRLKEGKGQGEGEQSGPACETSSAADGRTGGSVWEKGLCGVRPPASQTRQRHVTGHEQPVLLAREQFSLRERQLYPPAGKGLFNLAEGSRGAQPRTATCTRGRSCA